MTTEAKWIRNKKIEPAHIEMMRRAKQSPSAFVAEVLGCKLYGKQNEILRAIATSSRVSVAGANGTGKDFTTARAILWWLSVYRPAKAIVTGPTFRQVNDIVWNELRHAYANSRWPLGGQVFETPRWRIDEENFALGFSTDKWENLQGFHSPHLLVVITEAHAIKQDQIDALRRLNPQCFVMTGNPFSTSGEFYLAHHSSRELYTTVELSAFDTPNLDEDAPREGWPDFQGMVTKRDVDNRREEWGETSPLFIGGVLGQFPDNLDDTIVPLAAVYAATRRDAIPEGRRIVAVDVARFGRDNTAVYERQGKAAKQVWKIQGRDTQVIAGWVGSYARDNKIDEIIVDDAGVGGGVTDRLRVLRGENRFYAGVTAFRGGANAVQKDRFVNAVAEVWWAMRNWFMSGDVAVSDDTGNGMDALMAQVSTRHSEVQSDMRIALEQKKNLARSPDEADALAMTFWNQGDRELPDQEVGGQRFSDMGSGRSVLDDGEYDDMDNEFAEFSGSRWPT